MNCQVCGLANAAGASACISCGALLAGTVDPQGARCRQHPETPAAGTCSRCGSFACGPCLTARGADRWCPDCIGRVGSLPWDNRDTLGMWRAWWQTSLAMIIRPLPTLQAAGPQGTLSSSLLFSFLSSIAGYATTFLAYALMMIPIAFLNDQPGPQNRAVMAVGMPVMMLVMGVLSLGFQCLWVLITAGFDHLMLMLLGAKPQSYEVSVRANALSSGPMLVGLIPFCGLYVFPIWSMVLRVFGLMQLHQTTAGKAVLAVLLPVILFCGLCGSAYLALFVLGISQAR